MNQGFPRWLPAVVLLTWTSGCGDESTGPEDVDYEGLDPIVFSQHVQPLLQASCATADCHSGAAPSVGLGLDSYGSLAEGSDFGSAVVPGFPDRSHLYLHVSGQVPPRMPLNGSPLDEAVVAFFRRWILEGAVSDDGAPMYSGIGRKAFVACQGDNLVAAIGMDPAGIQRGQLIGLIDIRMPHSVHVDADARRLYVSRFESASDNIQMYDADTYELLGVARAGSRPALMQVVRPAGFGPQLWVTNFDNANPQLDHAVRILDAGTLQEITNFQFASGIQPHGIAVNAAQTRVYICNVASSTVTVFGTDSNSAVPPGPYVIKTPVPMPDAATVSHQPQQCVLSADESTLFVSALGSDKVYAVDVTTLDQPTPTWTSVDVGAAPWHLALSPDGTELWVVNWVGESVSVIDVSNPASMTVTHTLQPVHPHQQGRQALERPMGIGFSPDGTLVYVTSTNDNNEGQGHHPPPNGQKRPGNVALFDAATKSLVRVTEVPNFARFISFLE